MNNRESSSFDSKSCYRLYAGHSNWINLNARTTQDLLNIFKKGEPCRYQLEPGLFIDIIPNDVDCNSKNIDMIGLMRADLVYDSQYSENQVQQQMSHYVRSLLDEQGIIDTFPPLRKGEKLPVITSLPTHRHLSLVPSIVGSVRRGPKVQNQSLSSSKNPSSASSVNEETIGIPFSSSSSQSSSRRKNSQSKRTSKKARQNSYENSSKRQSFPMDSSTMINTSFATQPSTMINMKTIVDNQPVLPLAFSHQQQQEEGEEGLQSQAESHYWETTNGVASTYEHAPLYSQQRTSHNFPFEIDLNFEHATLQHQRQSPTDILNEYHSHFSFHGENDIQAYSSPITSHQLTENESAPSKMFIKPSTQHFVSSDTNSLESFVPASPIQAWQNEDKNEDKREEKWIQTAEATAGTSKHNSNKHDGYFTENGMTTLPVIERLILQPDTTNNIIFSHVNRAPQSDTMSPP